MHDPNETADSSRWDLFRGRRGVIAGVAAASLVGGGVASAATIGITQAVDDEPSVSASGDPAVTSTTAAPDKAGGRDKDKPGKDKDGGDKRGDKPGSGGDKNSSDTSQKKRGGGDSSASSRGSRASTVGSSGSGSDSGDSGGSRSGGSGSDGSGSTKKSSGRDSSSGDRSSSRRTSTTAPSTPAGGTPSPTGVPTSAGVTDPTGTEPATTTPDRPQDVAALVGVPVVGGDVPAVPDPVAGETTGGQPADDAPTTDVEQPADTDPTSPAVGTEAPTGTETSAPVDGGGTAAVDEAPTAPLAPEPLTDGQLDSAFDEALAPGVDPTERDALFEAGPGARAVSDRLAGVTGPAVDLEWSGVTVDPADPARANAVVESDGFAGGPLQVTLVHTGDGWAVADDSTCAIGDALGVPCAP